MDYRGHRVLPRLGDRPRDRPAIIALLLRGILAAPWTVVAFLALMLTTTSWTAAGRLHQQDVRVGRR